jgi:hypothetical protein
MLFECVAKDNTTEITYESICDEKGGQSCFMTESPLTFLQEKQSVTTESAEAAVLATLDDAKLMKLVNSGQGGMLRGNGNIIEVSVIFGDTSPADVT